MIWSYVDTEEQLLIETSGTYGALLEQLTNCKFCKTQLRLLGIRDFSKHEEGDLPSKNKLLIRVCDICGWWTAEHQVENFANRHSNTPLLFQLTGCACGSLINLDVTKINSPLDELRSYLLVKYEERFNLNPRRFEEIVAGVFADYGYRVKVTSYSGDKGIDVAALEGESGDMIGIQVKRYRGKIEAEQIRSFAGALILNKIPKGVFVSTSAYTSGAETTADQFSSLGIPIDLVDGTEFYKKLQITSRSTYTSIDDPTTPFYQILKNPSLPVFHVNKAYI